MEKSKLIAIANKLSNVFLKKYSGKMKPSDVYQSLRENEMYKPLFSKANGDILIISFLVSIPKIHRESQFENIVSNLFTFTYYEIENDEVEGACDSCGGDGFVDCNTCDGNGKVDCEVCDGSGEDEEGNSCNECQGGGNVECDDCGGDGTVNCDECDGSGDTRLYDTYEIEQHYCASYDLKILSVCEMYDDEDVITGGDIQSIENRNRTILLTSETRNVESNSLLYNGDVHFYGISRVPEFYGNGNYISDTYLDDKD
jgi:hypothetical protein